MRTLHFAAAIALNTKIVLLGHATALHAEEPPVWLRESTVSGIHDRTALIVDWLHEPCEPAREPAITHPGQVPIAFQHQRKCDEAETRFREELWARHMRRVFGDPGRH